MLAATVPIALTIGGFLLGFVSQIIALTRISAVVAGLTFCLEPVVAAITSAIVLDERLGVTQYAGGALVIGAIMLNVWLESRRRA
jgi:drug/metabolite transporter (DMT)-like permease